MNQQSVKILTEGVSLLPKGDQTFAHSLLQQLTKKGTLSEKQWAWVERFANDVECVGVPDFTKEEVHVGEFGGVIALFTKAKQYLKFPKIALQLANGHKVQLALAGNGSKAPGTVTVTDGAPYGQSKWYGRVTKDGLWEPTKTADAIKNDLTSILAQLAHDPAGTAAAYGKLSGACCFCMSKLTDPKSTAVGYGPQCAKQWGLPWGEAAKKAA